MTMLLRRGNQGKICCKDVQILTCVSFSQFGYYDTNETVANLMEREIFKEDLIGLKTLYKEKRLHVITVPGVNHFMWHKNTSVVDNYILPYLD